MTAPEQPEVIEDPRGFDTWTASIGIRDDSPDFAVVVSRVPAVAVGMYTQSLFAGPSIALSRAATDGSEARAVAVISKNANVANGAQGDADAAELQQLVADNLGLESDDVVVASTGVIGRAYPMDRIRRHIVDEMALPQRGDFDAVARAIMTTDTFHKVARAQVGDATIVGVAKGVGMIEPDMATLLTFFFTDAELDADTLRDVFQRVIATTFNALSIDTDTSTSDTAVVLANGLAGEVDHDQFEAALHDVALSLTMAIAGDGEGATKTIEVTVGGARDDDQAKRVAKAIVNSPLVKTAVHGADPNWGRVAMAIGKCHDETDIDQSRVAITIGDDELFPATAGAAQLARAEAHMGGSHVRIGATLGIGQGTFTVYGCDLTDGYVRINADYTT